MKAVVLVVCMMVVMMVGAMVRGDLVVKEWGQFNTAFQAEGFNIDPSGNYLYATLAVDYQQIYKFDRNLKLAGYKVLDVSSGWTVINDTTAFVIIEQLPENEIEEYLTTEQEFNNTLDIYFYNTATLTKTVTVSASLPNMVVGSSFYIPSFSPSSLLLLFAHNTNLSSLGILQVDIFTGAILNKYAFEFEVKFLTANLAMSFPIPSADSSHSRVGIFDVEWNLHIFNLATWQEDESTYKLRVSPTIRPIIVYNINTTVMAYLNKNGDSIVFYNLDTTTEVLRVPFPSPFQVTTIDSDQQGIVYVAGSKNQFVANGVVMKLAFDGTNITKTSYLYTPTASMANAQLAFDSQGLVYNGDWYTNCMNGTDLNIAIMVVLIGEDSS